MAELTQAEQRRVSVVAEGRHHDVVVDARARLGDVLDGLGLPPGTEVLCPDGSRPARTAALATAGLADGDVLVAVDAADVAPARVRTGGALSAAHAPGSRTGQDIPGDDDPAPAAAIGRSSPGTSSHLRSGVLAAVALALLVLTAAVVLLTGSLGGAAPGGVVLVGSLALAWAATGLRTQAVAVAGTALGAGLLAGTIDLAAGAGHLTVAGAALGATVAVVLGPTRNPRTARARRTVIAAGLLTVVGATLALSAGIPVTVLAVAGIAISVPLARVLPDLILDVDDGATVDLDRLATTAWSPRPRPGRRRWGRLVRGDLDERVHVAAAHQRVVLVGTLAVVLVTAGGLVAAAPGARAATAVLLVTAGGGLCLVARRYHGSVDRWVLRLAGLAALTAAGLAAAGAADGGSALALVLVACVAGLVLVLLAPVAGRGWTSLPLSRLADVLEALCVAAALPLAVWAAGLIPWIRDLVS